MLIGRLARIRVEGGIGQPVGFRVVHRDEQLPGRTVCVPKALIRTEARRENTMTLSFWRKPKSAASYGLIST